MKDIAFRYAFKVWLTTMLVSPLLLAVYQGIVYTGGFIWWVFFGVIFGAALGAPSFVLLWLSAKWLIRATNPVRCKVYLSILILPLAALAFFIGYVLIGYSINTVYLTIPYVLVAVVAVWFCKIKRVNSELVS